MLVLWSPFLICLLSLIVDDILFVDGKLLVDNRKSEERKKQPCQNWKKDVTKMFGSRMSSRSIWITKYTWDWRTTSTEQIEQMTSQREFPRAQQITQTSEPCQLSNSKTFLHLGTVRDLVVMTSFPSRLTSRFTFDPRNWELPMQNREFLCKNRKNPIFVQDHRPWHYFWWTKTFKDYACQIF